MFVYIYSKTAPHHRKWCSAFAKGLEKHNVRHKITYSISYMKPEDADLHVFWSMKHGGIINFCYKNKIPFICLERGYLNRDKFTSVNLNGLNGRSTLNVSKYSANNNRALMHGWEINPRKENGDIIYVMGQMPGDAALGGVNIYDWAYERLKEYSKIGKKVMFKPHPFDVYHQNLTDFRGFEIFNGTIKEALKDAELIHTYSSNSAVEAWMNGVPAKADSEFSMIYNWQSITGHCIDMPQFINSLSYKQYNEEEFKSGAMWDIVKQCI